MSLTWLLCFHVFRVFFFCCSDTDVICGCEVPKGSLRSSKKALRNLLDIRKKRIYWLIVIKFNSPKENSWGRLEKVSMWGRATMEKMRIMCVIYVSQYSMKTIASLKRYVNLVRFWTISIPRIKQKKKKSLLISMRDKWFALRPHRQSRGINLEHAFYYYITCYTSIDNFPVSNTLSLN